MKHCIISTYHGVSVHLIVISKNIFLLMLFSCNHIIYLALGKSFRSSSSYRFPYPEAWKWQYGKNGSQGFIQKLNLHGKKASFIHFFVWGEVMDIIGLGILRPQQAILYHKCVGDAYTFQDHQCIFWNPNIPLSL